MLLHSYSRGQSAALVRLECHNCVYYVYYVNHSQALLISTSTSTVLRVRVRIMSRSQLSCECEYDYESTRTRGRQNECRTSEGKLYEHGTSKQRHQLN